MDWKQTFHFRATWFAKLKLRLYYEQGYWLYSFNFVGLVGKDQALSLHACIASFQNLKAVTYFGQGSLPVTAKFNSKVVLRANMLSVRRTMIEAAYLWLTDGSRKSLHLAGCKSIYLFFFKVCVAVNQYFLLWVFRPSKYLRFFESSSRCFCNYYQASKHGRASSLLQSSLWYCLNIKGTWSYGNSCNVCKNFNQWKKSLENVNLAWTAR